MFLRKIIDKFNGSVERAAQQLTRIVMIRDLQIDALEDKMEILKSILISRDVRIEALEAENDSLRKKNLTKASAVTKPTKAKKKKKKNA